jgi:GTP cyclohydrolase II
MEKVETLLSTQHGSFTIVCYTKKKGEPDFALVHGDINGKPDVLARVQSECITGHVFKSLSCDCYEQLQDALALLTSGPEGVLIYLRQEGRGIGLAAKLRSYVLQRQGLDTVDANLHLGFQVDERQYDEAAEILRDLNVQSVRLITNNPKKAQGLESAGMPVTYCIPLPPTVRDQNRNYLRTKAERMGHTFEMDG